MRRAAELLGEVTRASSSSTKAGADPAGSCKRAKLELWLIQGAVQLCARQLRQRNACTA